MRIEVYQSLERMAEAAARQAAAAIRTAAETQEEITIVVATGTSQLKFLEKLAACEDLDWARTVFFHLDEYVGLPASHPASFRKYLKEKVEGKFRPKYFHYVNGEHPDPQEECRRLGGLIGDREVDLAFVGIGENGHLAFNDPPADFGTEEPYIVVTLDEACRRQQVNEGWFASLEDVPEQAISMSIRQILKAKTILCIVPEERKAKAVDECFSGGVSNLHPASILQTHPQCTVFLDSDSASVLRKQT
jgi:glucosamine-6-phosphate deaminase